MWRKPSMKDRRERNPRSRGYLWSPLTIITLLVLIHLCHFTQSMVVQSEEELELASPSITISSSSSSSKKRQCQQTVKLASSSLPRKKVMAGKPLYVVIKLQALNKKGKKTGFHNDDDDDDHGMLKVTLPPGYIYQATTISPKRVASSLQINQQGSSLYIQDKSNSVAAFQHGNIHIHIKVYIYRDISILLSRTFA